MRRRRNGKGAMKATETLHQQGQSLWLDNITRSMLDSGQIQRFIDQYSVTGLTSNPSIFDKAIASGDYDDAIQAKARAGLAGEDLFFDLAIEDLQRAADLFLPVHERTDGVDGWVSLEVSPLLAYDTERTVQAATSLHARAGRPNLLIKIPGTPQGLPAVEECIAAGIPVNVTLLFSAAHYEAAADAFCAGLERRIGGGQDPDVGSVASVFMSRWDTAVAGLVPSDLDDRLGLAIGLQTYRAYRQLMASGRWQRLANSGARVQRLLWASTGTKDPNASDTHYVHGLAAPFTINTMPDKTLQAFYEHGDAGPTMPADGGQCEAELARFAEAGIDTQAIADKLQSDGAASFASAWKDLMTRINAAGPALA
jgi:transaldolase